MSAVKTLICYAIAIAVVLAVCGMAMLVTGRDNDCTARGGHVRGVAAQECVTP